MQGGVTAARIQIAGGADEYTMAAISAVIQRVEEERAFTPRPDNPNAQSAWLRSGRHQPIARFSPPVHPAPGLNWPNA